MGVFNIMNQCSFASLTNCNVENKGNFSFFLKVVTMLLSHNLRPLTRRPILTHKHCLGTEHCPYGTSCSRYEDTSDTFRWQLRHNWTQYQGVGATQAYSRSHTRTENYIGCSTVFSSSDKLQLPVKYFTHTHITNYNKKSLSNVSLHFPNHMPNLPLKFSSTHNHNQKKYLVFIEANFQNYFIRICFSSRVIFLPGRHYYMFIWSVDFLQRFP